MATAKVITFQCEQCGTEVVVNAAGEMELSPIYCCGMMVSEVPLKKKAAKAKKKVTKKTATKKVAKKKTAKKVSKKKAVPKKGSKK